MTPTESDQTANYAPIFISYASEDRPSAEWLHSRLWDVGYRKVWWDRADIEGGDRWREEIDKGLLSSYIILSLVSKKSIDPARFWIQYEQTEARRLFRALIPLLLEQIELPAAFADVQCLDLTGDREATFKQLVTAIEKHTLRPGARFADQTPAHDHPFVGREKELQEIVEWLENDARTPTGRLSVAIQGMGGTGKTMVANELVRRLAIRYPGGVVTVKRGQSEKQPVEAVLQTWAQFALGRRPERQWSPGDLRSYLREHHGELLVLLDDVAEADFDSVRVLLESMPPDATRLITTRSRAFEDKVGGLLFSLDQLSSSDGVLLLQKRLERIKGGEPDAKLLETFVETVGGHALSLHLLAGRCEHVRELAEELELLQEALAEGDLEAIDLDFDEPEDESKRDKRTSVAVNLRLSLRGLEKQQDKAGHSWAERFKALGVFPNGTLISRDMALAVWGLTRKDRSWAGRVLKGIRQKSMLFLDDDTGHYYHHPIVRSYAYGLLARDAASYRQVVDRYVDHVTEKVGEVLQQPPDQWTDMELYGPHLQQVGAVLLEETSTAADADRTEALARARTFGHAVRDYAVQRPELGDVGLTWLQMGLDAARALDDEAGTLAFLRSMGEWHERRDAAVAEQFDEQALALARKLGDRTAEAAVLSHYGELQRTQGRAEKALEVLDQALEVHRDMADAHMEAVTLKYLGETYWRKGNFQKAQELQEMALAIFEKLGNTSGVGDIYNKIGSINFAAGDHRKAVGYFQKALEIHEQVGNRSMAAEDLNDMGAARKYLGELDEAMVLLSSALDIHEEVGNRRLQAMTKANISSIHLMQGRIDDGVRVATEALDAAREANAAVAETWALNWLGVASEEQEAYDDARKHFEGALECSRRAKNPRGEAGVLGNLGQLLAQKLGEPREGLALLERGRDVMEANKLSQAFGGRRLDDFRDLIRDIQAMLS